MHTNIFSKVAFGEFDGQRWALVERWDTIDASVVLLVLP
jgi:hypothetical protein